MTDRGRVLIVENDPMLLATLTREVGRTHEVVPCASAAVAFGAIEGDPPVGMIVDLYLGVGPDGVDVVARLRKLAGSVPALIMTGANTVSAETTERISQLGSGVWFARKPFGPDELRRFLELAMIMASLDVADGKALATAVRDVATHARLTAVERELLAQVARGAKRTEMADRLGANENTLKTRIHNVLHKTGHRDVRELRSELLRNAGLSHKG